MNHEAEPRESLITELSERLYNGVIKENPTFVLLLGMCPTLAVTTSAVNGLGMGVTTMVVLALSNMFISLLRKVIPNKIRIPAFIVIIASFVTIVELLLNAYIPSLYSALGLYIPLIVVNCIILGRAEAYAYSHNALLSLFDGLGMGMGFTFALTIIGSIREILGAGTIFNVTIMPKSYVPVNIFIMAPGAFFVLAAITAIQNKIKEIGTKKGKDMSRIQSGCGGNCAECNLESGPDKANNKTVKEEEKSNPVSEVKPLQADKETKVNEAAVEDSAPDIKETLNEAKSSGTNDVLNQNSAMEEIPVSTKFDSESEGLKTSEPVLETVIESHNNADSNGELEILDLSDLKSALRSTNTVLRKPVHKRSTLKKAEEMLKQAEEKSKEEEKND